MKRLSILLCAILSFVGKASYSQRSPKAKELTDSAKVLGMTRYAIKHMPRVTIDSLYRMKISLINKAIRADSNYFEAFLYKFLFLDQMKDDRGALIAAKRALQLNSKMEKLKYKIGLAYDRIGDSVSAGPYYQSFLSYCNAVLDTMPAKDRQRFGIQEDKINTLILLGEKEKSQEQVNKLREMGNSMGMFFDDMYYESYMRKTRTFMIKNRDIIYWRHYEPN